MLGVPTSEIEVSLASNKGFWLLIDEEELFVPFSEFPWFQQASIQAVMTVEKPSSNHLYWPLLDIDLSIDSIRNPSAFPMFYKA